MNTPEMLYLLEDKIDHVKLYDNDDNYLGNYKIDKNSIIKDYKKPTIEEFYWNSDIGGISYTKQVSIAVYNNLLYLYKSSKCYIFNPYLNKVLKTITLPDNVVNSTNTYNSPYLISNNYIYIVLNKGIYRHNTIDDTFTLMVDLNDYVTIFDKESLFIHRYYQTNAFDAITIITFIDKKITNIYTYTPGATTLSLLTSDTWNSTLSYIKDIQLYEYNRNNRGLYLYANKSTTGSSALYMYQSNGTSYTQLTYDPFGNVDDCNPRNSYAHTPRFLKNLNINKSINNIVTRNGDNTSNARGFTTFTIANFKNRAYDITNGPVFTMFPISIPRYTRDQVISDEPLYCDFGKSVIVLLSDKYVIYRNANKNIKQLSNKTASPLRSAYDSNDWMGYMSEYHITYDDKNIYFDYISTNTSVHSNCRWQITNESSYIEYIIPCLNINGDCSSANKVVCKGDEMLYKSNNSNVIKRYSNKSGYIESLPDYDDTGTFKYGGRGILINENYRVVFTTSGSTTTWYIVDMNNNQRHIIENGYPTYIGDYMTINYKSAGSSGVYNIIGRRLNDNGSTESVMVSHNNGDVYLRYDSENGATAVKFFMYKNNVYSVGQKYNTANSEISLYYYNYYGCIEYVCDIMTRAEALTIIQQTYSAATNATSGQVVLSFVRNKQLHCLLQWQFTNSNRTLYALIWVKHDITDVEDLDDKIVVMENSNVKTILSKEV